MEAKLKMMSMAVLMAALVLSACTAARTQGLCNMSQDGFTACKPAVTSSFLASTPDPSAACCAAIAGADMRCLCSYKDSKVLPALGIDPKLAMALPEKCGVALPNPC
ncbi:putative lipid-transfer protein [Nymphaea thermarum]|uniref:Bifunctional inhibitor/plant lipid transfer protein/seed storage helical domain-containing protein n=1 Tax=Nymphaea colorata TaxID=210225 RepID=A0A5K1A3H8_9MAGN|nr:putative lipid-transfer protein DIR1 [Nymphaea colorata]KAF3780543.1 putative lipid-transfer protein [Nymphaea thermarum]